MALAAGASTGLARLGETSQAIDDRYGQPLSTDVLSGFTRCQYQKQSFVVTVFYEEGRSILEIFAKRGFAQDEASQLVSLVATHPVDPPSPAQEEQIRHAARITSTDEVFWAWTNPAAPVDAAFNPIECTLAFFSDPGVYARVQHALASAPLAGSDRRRVTQGN